MQDVGTQLEAVLDARDRDLSVLYEIYASDYDPSAGFDPRDAEVAFAGISYTLPFGPVTYKRQVLTGPSIQKNIKKQSNTVSIKFSNVDTIIGTNSRYMANYVNTNIVEGKKLVIRVISRSVATSIGNSVTILTNSLTYAFRLEKPDGFNRSEGTLSAKQDLGTIEAVIPARRFQPSCPLEYKGPECLGTETLSEKSATYQNEATCKFTFADCDRKENTEFFQGTRIVQIESSFVHKSHESFLKKILNILPGISRKITTVNSSTHDGTPYGNAIPVILGRWAKELIALEFKDIGTSINFKMAACRGKISDFINVRNESPGFTQPIGVTKHLGEYGGDGSQTADTVFPEHQFHSRLAYVTGYCNGSDIETEDPAPQITSVIAGIVPDEIYFDVDHDGTGKLAAGTGGVTVPGSSTTEPGTPAADFDTAIVSRDPKSYVKLEDAGGPTITATVGVGGQYDVLATFHEDGPIETDATSYGVGSKVGTLPAPAGSDLDLKDKITINGWGITGSLQTLVCRNGLEGESGSNFVTMLDSGARFDLFIDGSDYTVFGEVDGITEGQYVMATAVRDGSFMAIYINGCLAGSRTDLPTSNIDYSPSEGYDTGNDKWKIGYSGPAGHIGEVWFAVATSHVSFYDYAWNAQDVANVWASAVNTPTGCPGEDWTDNPVDHARWLITEPSALNLPSNQINDFLSAYTAAWNCGAVKDDTNAERGLLPNTEIDRAGVDYQRYTSTGLLGPRSFESSRTQIPAGVPARALINNGLSGDAVGEYEFFDPDDKPTSLDVQIVHRKRFTENTELTTEKKVLDVIYDQIFPTFGGFLRWDSRGRVVIDSERPADWTKLREGAEAGADEIIVNDVLPWKSVLGSPYLLEGKIHIDFSITWSYGNAAERTTATEFTSGDVGKYALQKDNNSVWILTAVTPTWTQVTELTSEVRSVESAVYSDLGDEITLAAAASGGPTAAASGATLSGGSPTVQSSATVTISGSLAAGSSITVTIDGIDCVLNLVNGESSSVIGHRMACVINAEPGLNEYVEAHAVDNVVTVYSKIGVLTLSSALEEDHPSGHEVTRVMGSYAGKALTYADTTRANILDGSFEWPEASRQPVINQIKATHREAILDFAEYPIVVNDFDHQRAYVKVSPQEVDHSAIDNYNTSARRANSLLNKFRDGDRFFKLGSTGRALLHDEGDVICASDASGPYRNVLMRIEDITINNNLEVSFVCRRYSRNQFSDLVPNPVDAELPSGLPNFQQPPPTIAFNEADFPPNGLTQSTDGSAGLTSIRGGLIFGDSVYASYAKVRLIKRGGVTVDESINGHLDHNSDNEAVFEFTASVDGLYTVAARACNQWGCSAEVTADIIIGFGTLFGIATEAGDPMSTEGSALIEREH